MKCLGSLFLLSPERVPLWNSSLSFWSWLAVLAAPGQGAHQLSRGVSVFGKVQAELSGLTMGVSLTELGAFKHDDSYFRAPRGGSLPTPPSPRRWNLGASIGGAVNHGPLLCEGEVISCEPSQWEMIRQQALHTWHSHSHTHTLTPWEYIGSSGRLEQFLQLDPGVHSWSCSQDHFQSCEIEMFLILIRMFAKWYGSVVESFSEVL